MTRERLQIVCLLAREPGVRVLEWLLSRATRFHVRGLWTHRLRPASEDPERRRRPEFSRFQALTRAHEIPLFVVDSRREADLAPMAFLEPYDLLLSVSWRFLVPESRLGASRLGDLNVHRGELPRYKGAEPVRRMLTDGLGYATLSAHLMTARYDEGEVIHAVRMPARVQRGEAIAEATERVKRELLDRYTVCVAEAIRRLQRRFVGADAPAAQESLG
ncbi:MAG: formyltransferase family protein [Myxococcota bacterium]